MSEHGTQQSEAKAETLGLIRAALSDNPQPPTPQHAYQRTGELSHDAVREMLVDRLVDYKAAAYVESRESVRERIALLLKDVKRYVIPKGFDTSLLPEDDQGRVRVVDAGDSREDGALSHEDLDGMDAVITGSTVSCAETGTVFLDSRADEGRRAISLIPDHHICIVEDDSIVQLIPEALARVDHTRPITMFSGPSATSDIELQRVEGVHGPRRLDVIILR